MAGDQWGSADEGDRFSGAATAQARVSLVALGDDTLIIVEGHQGRLLVRNVSPADFAA